MRETAEYPATCGRREYVGTPQRCTVQTVEQGGIADLRFVLDRKFDSVRGDFLFPPKQETD